jgi:hypothetical protein
MALKHVETLQWLIFVFHLERASCVCVQILLHLMWKKREIDWCYKTINVKIVRWYYYSASNSSSHSSDCSVPSSGMRWHLVWQKSFLLHCIVPVPRRCSCSPATSLMPGTVQESLCTGNWTVPFTSSERVPQVSEDKFCEEKEKLVVGSRWWSGTRRDWPTDHLS